MLSVHLAKRNLQLTEYVDPGMVAITVCVGPGILEVAVSVLHEMSA